MRIVVHDYAGHPFQFDLSRALARRGHTVGHFYFAGDKGPKGAVNRQPDDPGGFSVHAMDLAREYSKTKFVQRALNDIAYGKLVSQAIADFKPDVVISSNTPLNAQFYLLAATHKIGAGFIFWMQDFYSLAVSRLFKKRWLGLGWLIAQYYINLEKRLLQKGDAIVYITSDFVRSTKNFGLKNKPSYVIPNWASIENLPVRDKHNAWSKANDLEGAFVFLYSGTLALKHNPALLRALAQRYSDRDDVIVAVAAHGVGRDALEASLAQAPLPNLRLFPLQPLETLPDMLGAADVLVALLEADAGEFSVPSKILTYYCAQRPILLSAPLDNLASRITAQNESGEVASPGDEAAFLDAADRFLNDEDLRRRAGLQGRKYAEEQFKIDAIADQFEAVVQVAADARRSVVHKQRTLGRWRLKPAISS